MAAVSRAERLGRRRRRAAADRNWAGQKRPVEGARCRAGCRRRLSSATSWSSPRSRTASSTRSPTTAPMAAKPGGAKRRRRRSSRSQDRRQPGRVDARDRRRAHRFLLRIVRAVLLRPGGQGAVEVRNAGRGDRRRFRHGRVADSCRRSGDRGARRNERPEDRCRRRGHGRTQVGKETAVESAFCTPAVWDTPDGKQIVVPGFRRDDRLRLEDRRGEMVTSRACRRRAARRRSPRTATLFFAGWSPGDPPRSGIQDADVRRLPQGRRMPTRTACCRRKSR